MGGGVYMVGYLTEGPPQNTPASKWFQIGPYDISEWKKLEKINLHRLEPMKGPETINKLPNMANILFQQIITTTTQGKKFGPYVWNTFL